jgi:peptidoglycan/xylan/chitin deacetylase (PgdA/CDA1 family)
MSLNDLVQNIYDGQQSGRRIASITFDDGYKDNFSYAFPLLKKHHVPATVFLTTGPIDSRSLLWWDKIAYVVTHATNDRLSLGELGDYKLGDAVQRIAVGHEIISDLKTVPNEHRNEFTEELILGSGVEIPAEAAEEAMMTWEDIRAMHSEGISFGAHSVSHPALASIPIEQATSEIRESKSQIQNHTDQRVDFFAYPNGDFDSIIAKVVENCGFIGAVTAEPVWITRRTDRFKLGRMGIYWDDLGLFRIMLSGIQRYCQRLWNTERWT